MNIEETKKAIEVMQAFVDGKEIQYLSDGNWFSYSLPATPAWAWSETEYRVKPETITCWITVLNDHVASTVHASEEDAYACLDKHTKPDAHKNGAKWTVRKVVIE